MTADPALIQQIIHKHVHDVRNSINCLDLQAVLLEEQGTDPEVAATLTGIRAELPGFNAATEAANSSCPTKKIQTPHPTTGGREAHKHHNARDRFNH